jgi:prevent-host-death family protein
MFTATATTSFARSDWMWTFSLGGYGGPWEDAGDIYRKGIGVDQSRPQLGEYVARAEDGEVWVIASRSKPKGVLIGYSRYEELKRLARSE